MSELTRRSNRLLVGDRIIADYCELTESLYRHNCYIEALGQPLTPVEAARLIRREPICSEEERKLPALQRIEAVHRIAKCVFTMPDVLELEQKFSKLIRNGYFSRNPLEAEWVRQMRAGFPDLEKDHAGRKVRPLIRSSASGIAIIGCSGVGKSTMVESVLGLYPQVIVHTQYNGKPFDQQQLVWLKLECPHDGTLLGLCTDFFMSIDDILGTDYTVRYCKPGVPVKALLPKMRLVAATLGLGVLVIDEIQRLSSAHSGGDQEMMDFFVHMTNTIGIPVVIVGTYKAMKLVNKEFAAARRAAGIGDSLMSNLNPDEDWDRFLDKLWKYQWTNVPTPLTKDLRKAMYRESVGIVDIAAKIYMLLQWSVIGTDNESITPDMVEEVSAANFFAARPILEALRNKDISILSQVKDVVPLDGEIEKFLANAVRRVTISGALDTLSHQEQPNVTDATEQLESPSGQITALLVGAGFSFAVALKCANEAVQRFASSADLKLASSEAFRLAAEFDTQNEQPSESNNVPKTAKKTAKAISLSGDLRQILAVAKKTKKPAYDVFKEAGVIRSALEFQDLAGG